MKPYHLENLDLNRMAKFIGFASELDSVQLANIKHIHKDLQKYLEVSFLFVLSPLMTVMLFQISLTQIISFLRQFFLQLNGHFRS
jgi:hypothetical protein